MLDSLLTQGAQRAFAAATVLAARNGQAECEPLHLLWALCLDESQASESLRKAGVTPGKLEACSPLRGPAPTIEELASPTQSTPNPVSESAQLRRVLARAAQLASLRTTEPQVSTEDLLAGLVSVESPASTILAHLGMKAHTSGTSGRQLGFAEQPATAKPGSAQGIGAAEASASEPESLPVDFTIRWNDSPEVDRTGALRIVDAAANRAREGLRVLEDYARFALNDGHLTGLLKECRHELRDALAGLPESELLRSRDTRADVGTDISTHAETVRETPTDVVRAAFKRSQEAIRSLEEFSKLWSASTADRLQRLRYDLYTLEKSLLLTEINRRTLAGQKLYLLLSESLCHHGLGPAARGALAGGVHLVQLREKELPQRRLIEQACRVRQWTREAGALFVMNDRPDLAVVSQADGVHVGQDDLSVKEAREIVGPRRLVGVSTHTIEQARQAVLDGADYLGVGPVFPSRTKSFPSLAGLELVRQVAAEITLPWFAIGGIDADNIGDVLAAGARRVAVGYAITSAEDSAAAARALSERLAAADPL